MLKNYIFLASCEEFKPPRVEITFLIWSAIWIWFVKTFQHSMQGLWLVLSCKAKLKRTFQWKICGCENLHPSHLWKLINKKWTNWYFQIKSISLNLKIKYNESVFHYYTQKRNTLLAFREVMDSFRYMGEAKNRIKYKYKTTNSNYSDIFFSYFVMPSLSQRWIKISSRL